MLLLRVWSGVKGAICGAGGNGGGIDELILLLIFRTGELEELRFLGFGDSCGTLWRLRFVVVLIVVLFTEDWLLAALIMVGSGARGR